MEPNNVIYNILSLIDRIQTLFIQGVTDDVLWVLSENGEWFSMSQILLPHKFVVNWRSTRIGLRQIKLKETQLEKVDDEIKRSGIIEEISERETFVSNLVDEAEKALRKDMDLSEIKISRWQKETGS